MTDPFLPDAVFFAKKNSGSPPRYIGYGASFNTGAVVFSILMLLILHEAETEDNEATRYHDSMLVC